MVSVHKQLMTDWFYFHHNIYYISFFIILHLSLRVRWWWRWWCEAARDSSVITIQMITIMKHIMSKHELMLFSSEPLDGSSAQMKNNTWLTSYSVTLKKTWSLELLQTTDVKLCFYLIHFCELSRSFMSVVFHLKGQRSCSSEASGFEFQRSDLLQLLIQILLDHSQKPCVW